MGSSRLSDEEEEDACGESGTEKQQPQPKGWRERVKRWLRAAASSSTSPRTRAAAVSFVVLTAMAYVAYRKNHPDSRRKRRRTSIDQHSSSSTIDYRSASIAPLSLLLAAIEHGTLQRALLGSTRVFFQIADDADKNNNTWKRVDLPHSNPEIRKQVLTRVSNTGGGGAQVSVLPERDWSQVLTALVAALPFVYLALVYRMLRDQTLTGGDMKSTLQQQSSSGNSSNERITFRHVAGLDDAVTEVSEVVQFLRDPARYRRLGATAPRGVLLVGPPGCGKTQLARAVAGEAGVDCYFGACTASEFVEVYVGRGAARVREWFATARQRAVQRHRQRATTTVWQRMANRLGLMGSEESSISGTSSSAAVGASAILFIDELDALAKTRSSGRFGGISSNDEREQTLNQLLTEMDGFDQDESVTLIVMAATNRADVLDPAIMRRFDRQVRVSYPDAAGREAILKVHARRIRTASKVDWASVAEVVGDNVSGADLRNLINEAALLAVREGRGDSNSRSSNETVSQQHLEHAARRIRQMKEWNATTSITVGSFGF